jgi:hypothetical protein
VFKKNWDAGRVYRAHRIVPYSYKLSMLEPEASANYQDPGPGDHGALRSRTPRSCRPRPRDVRPRLDDHA